MNTFDVERAWRLAGRMGLSLAIAWADAGCGGDSGSSSGSTGGSATGGSATGGSATGGSGGATASGGGGGISMSGNVQYAATCEAPAPCGGDYTGTWKIDSVCTQVKPDLLLGCPTSQAKYQGVVSGTLTFAADSVDISTDVQMNPEVHVGAECVCPTLDPPFGKECIQDCVCYSNLKAKSGGQTMVAANGTAMTWGIISSDTALFYQQYQYCVDGDTMWLAVDGDSKYPGFAVMKLVR